MVTTSKLSVNYGRLADDSPWLMLLHKVPCGSFCKSFAGSIPVHTPCFRALLIHLVDGLLVPVGLCKRGRARIPVFQDSGQVSSRSTFSEALRSALRGVRAGDHHALYSRLFRRGLHDRERTCDGGLDEVVRLLHVPVERRSDMDDGAVSQLNL